MKRHTNKHLKILGVSMAVLAMAAMILEFAMPTRAKTTQTSEADVQFTFASKLDVDLGESKTVDLGEVDPGSTKASDETIDLSIGTNSSAGYYLSATAGNETTADFTSPTGDKITHLSSEDPGRDLDALDDNTWGVKIEGASSEVSNGKFIGLPKEIGGDDDNAKAEAGKKLLDESTNTARKTVKVTVGTKIGKTLKPGTYTTYLNFYAVAK